MAGCILFWTWVNGVAVEWDYVNAWDGGYHEHLLTDDV